MSVVGHHLLDLLKLFPANVALMGVWNQRPPLILRFAPSPATRLSVVILRSVFRLSVSISAGVDRVAQDTVNRRVSRAPPNNRAAWATNRHLQAVLQKPHQRLAGRTEFEELAEDQQQTFLHPAIRILFQAVLLTLQISCRRRYDQFATPRLLPPRLHRALPQQIQFIFVKAAFQTKEQTVIALPRRIHHFLINQERIHHATDLDQLLPLPTVPGESRYFSGCHRAHLPQAHLCDHALETGPSHCSRGRSAQIFIDDLDLAPTQVAQSFLHRVLELLALQVVVDLIGRGLTHIQNRLPFQMMRLDLFTHRVPPQPTVRRPVLCHAAAAVASAIAESSAEPRGAVPANPPRAAGSQTARVGWISAGPTTLTSAPPASSKY